MTTKLYRGIPLNATVLYIGIDIALTILFVFWASSRLVEGHGWGDDFGLYLQLADNLRSGKPYNDLNTGIQVPFGFPLLLAIWGKIFGLSFVSLKSLNIAAWIVAAWITRLLAAKTIGQA